jgi:hypothetical protein
MGSRLLRRFIVILSLLTFVGTGLAGAGTMGKAEPSGTAMAMAGLSMAPVPCCPGKAPSCMTGAGCVFLVGLPLPASALSGSFAWSMLAYAISHDRGEGLSIRPDLFPPILPA